MKLFIILITLLQIQVSTSEDVATEWCLLPGIQNTRSLENGIEVWRHTAWMFNHCEFVVSHNPTNWKRWECSEPIVSAIKPQKKERIRYRMKDDWVDLKQRE